MGQRGQGSLTALPLPGTDGECRCQRCTARGGPTRGRTAPGGPPRVSFAVSSHICLTIGKVYLYYPVRGILAPGGQASAGLEEPQGAAGRGQRDRPLNRAAAGRLPAAEELLVTAGLISSGDLTEVCRPSPQGK